MPWNDGLAMFFPPARRGDQELIVVAVCASVMPLNLRVQKLDCDCADFFRVVEDSRNRRFFSGAEAQCVSEGAWFARVTLVTYRSNPTQNAQDFYSTTKSTKATKKLHRRILFFSHATPQGMKMWCGHPCLLLQISAARCRYGRGGLEARPPFYFQAKKSGVVSDPAFSRKCRIFYWMDFGRLPFIPRFSSSSNTRRSHFLPSALMA